MIFRLPDDDVWFPDPLSIPPKYREADGCIAIGGDLRPMRLIEAYSQGIFPWSDFRSSRRLWYCPMRRFVIFPNEVHVSHSMRTLINKGKYRVTFDRDFEGVIYNCGSKRIHQPGAWLGPEMMMAYTQLYSLGYAHSVEVWDADLLVGGLYGVALNKVFFGESMFSNVASASKLALISLCRHMAAKSMSFIDCQFETPHLRSMGGRYISYEEYMELLWE